MNNNSKEEKVPTFEGKLILSLMYIGAFITASGFIIGLFFDSYYHCFTIDAVPASFKGEVLSSDELMIVKPLFYLILNTVPNIFILTGITFLVLSLVSTLLIWATESISKLISNKKAKKEVNNEN